MWPGSWSWAPKTERTMRKNTVGPHREMWCRKHITFMNTCSTGLFNSGRECKLPLLTDLFHENIKTAWLKYLNGEERVPAGTALNTACGHKSTDCKFIPHLLRLCSTTGVRLCPGTNSAPLEWCCLTPLIWIENTVLNHVQRQGADRGRIYFSSYCSSKAT